MRSLVSLIGALCALWLVVLLPNGAGAAGIRAATHDNFARMVFDWNENVTHTAEVQGRSLIVRFNRPFDGDPKTVLKPLGAYVSGVTLSEDRKSLTFALKGDYAATAFLSGQSVVVDLKPAKPDTTPDTKGDPKAEAATKADTKPDATTKTEAKPAQSGPQLPVRVGSHNDFQRLVFDWPKTVAYKVNTSGSQAQIVFDKPASINADALRNALPPSLKTFTVDTTASGLSIVLPIPEGGRVRHFTNGPKVVVDVLVSAEQAAKAAEESPAPQQLAALPQGDDDVSPASASNAKDKAAATTRPADAKGAAATALDKALKDSIQPPAALTAQTGSTAPPTGATPATAGKDDTVDTAAAPGVRSVVASLSFPWNEPTAAAVFERAGYYWVVFDRHQNVDMKLQKKLGGSVVQFIEQLPSRSATVVRMLIEPGYNASVRREGLLWVVDFMRQPYRPTHPVEISPQPKSPVGPRLFMPVSDAAKPLVLQDPEVGDRFITVPLLALGSGVYPPHSYPDATLPATIQGIVVEPQNDKVMVNTSRNGVDVTAQGGLTFSTDLAQIQATSSIGASTDLTRVLDIGSWMHGPSEDFIKNKQVLQAAVGIAPANRRNPARLELARFYFAHGYEAEALGILDTIAADSQDLPNSGAFKALHGAASFMMGRWAEAVDDFSHPSLAGVEEAAFWRALAQAELGQPELQAQTVRDFGGVLDGYPRAIKVPLALQAAQIVMQTGDDQATNTFLAAAEAEDNTPHEKAAITYINGKQAEMSGNYEGAIEKWGTLEDSSDRYYRALATRDRLELLSRMEQLDRPNLIKGLERLRFAWRGGPFELGLLMRLGDLYSDEKEYGKALRVWQQAATYFDKQPGAELAMNRMRETFDQLYYGGLADSMPPLRAIALYDEFRELTPTGEKGDEMIRRLADRLVSVDLLQQAAALLERQVKYRLGGAERAKVGARLGLVYLLDHQPDKAVEALLQSKSPETSPGLERQRQQLLARALADVGRPEDAVVLLEGDDSRNADLLRAEIEWKSGNWKAAAAALAKVVPPPEQATGMTEEDARLILDLGTALTLSQDERAVADLRVRYGTAMAQTPYKDAFTLITTPPVSGVIDYRTVADRIKQAENFKSFMSAYRERLRDGGLSAIN
ncbi:tetratricopeptide repeat protein [Insolitispirillum peregrinum]|uniref:tetratricopeptide repeat protein n=1 Tax=Insolitispirillum peregrinum TaxID=80876 RepID=UPI003606CF74